MNALVLTLFVSLALSGFAVLGFLFAVRGRDHEHSDRLSLLPLADDTGAPPHPAGGSGDATPAVSDAPAPMHRGTCSPTTAGGFPSDSRTRTPGTEGVATSWQ